MMPIDVFNKGGNLSKDLKFVRQFLILSIAIIAIVIGAVFFGFYLRTESLSNHALNNQARALFNEIIITRRWVTNNGGVYVKVKPGVDPHPYLLTIPGLKVTHRDEEGTLYTLKNPGLIVRELSEISDNSGLYTFHVASLKPVNKEKSSPDAFEREALIAFERGEREHTAIEVTEQGPVYRYMAPLYFENSCNKCHFSQGYKEGDIRGGISVNIPMASLMKEMRVNNYIMLGSGILVIAVLFGILYLISRRFVIALTHAQGELVEMAATDALTKLPNRRVGIERLEEEISRHNRQNYPLSCLMLDIDHFKEVNDKYGHLAGDAVLVSFGEVLSKTVRRHDFICRYGGEEFMVLLPETDLDAAITVAKKVMDSVIKNITVYNDHIIGVTVSIGVAQMSLGDDETADSLIHRADYMLYQAKAEGRNRIVAARPRPVDQKQAKPGNASA